MSGPLLYRIDLHIEVPALPYQELRGRDEGMESAALRARQAARGHLNAALTPQG